MPEEANVRRRRRRSRKRRPTEKSTDGPRFTGPVPAVFPIELPEEHLDDDAVKVIERLTRSGYVAYLVGGGVRDLILGRRPKDFDVATNAQPNDVKRLFRNSRIIGRRFRLAHVFFGRKIIEVATFRRDPAQRFEARPYRRPLEGMSDAHGEPSILRPLRMNDEADLLIKNDNVFGEPHEDAIRRDFTINGLFYDLGRHEVIDFVGGMADLRRGVVRTIGDPDQRFREDPVRILRAVKFSTRIDLGIDERTHVAMVEYRSHLARSAKPRLYEEVLRLLRGAAHRSVYLLWDLGILAELLPSLSGFLDDEADEHELVWRRLQVVDAELEDGTLSDSVLYAALLYGPLMEAMDGAKKRAQAFEQAFGEVTERLAVPRRVKDEIRMMMMAQRQLRQADATKLQKLKQRHYFDAAARLFLVDQKARGNRLPDWAYRLEPEHEDAPRRRKRRTRRRRRRTV